MTAYLPSLIGLAVWYVLFLVLLLWMLLTVPLYFLSIGCAALGCLIRLFLIGMYAFSHVSGRHFVHYWVVVLPCLLRIILRRMVLPRGIIGQLSRFCVVIAVGSRRCGVLILVSVNMLLIVLFKMLFRMYLLLLCTALYLVFPWMSLWTSCRYLQYLALCLLVLMFSRRSSLLFKPASAAWRVSRTQSAVLLTMLSGTGSG